MDPYLYLLFRRFIVFADEWCTYALLIYLYYHQQERRNWILVPIVVMAVVFNLTGYYYLSLLEEALDIYERQKIECWF